MRTAIADIVKKEGEEVELAGWVHARRDHGKLVFIDLRDRSGLAQVVFGPQIANAKELRLEYVVKLKGKVQARPPKLVNEKMATGKYEVSATELEILNASEATPISVDTDGYEINEETRLKYRYLDLRRERLTKNLIARHKIIKSIRDFLSDKGFIEVETPVLSKSTPEGARDYLVPSRIWNGKFYALPQSPQQYKQLLMVAGIEKYFQIARCFRDEDTRGDRQPEFTQLDMEISFVEREDVMRINEELLISIVKTLYPQKKIQETPFPRLSYKEAMEKYGTDRPDLRKDKEDKNLLAFCWVIDFPFFEKSPDSPSGWTFTHNPFSRAKEEFVDTIGKLGVPQSEMGSLKNNPTIPTILTSQYDVVLNGLEIGGGSIRNHKHGDLLAVFKILGYSGDEVKNKFEHMLLAFQYGAPPHGGIAWGLDRFVSLLENEPNIREVIAFPKTGEGFDPMMVSPAEVDKKQLEELGLEVKKRVK